ncbi:hypothetical protein D9M68_649300 [compost metagenome]
MRSDPARLMAAASSSLTQAISTALNALESASPAISATARPARAGSEVFSQSSMRLPPKSPDPSTALERQGFIQVTP